MLLRFCISRDSHHAGFFANCLLYNTTCFTTYRRGGLPPLQAQNHTPPKSSQARQISRGEPHQPCKIGETATPTASLLQPGAEGEQPPPLPATASCPYVRLDPEISPFSSHPRPLLFPATLPQPRRRNRSPPQTQSPPLPASRTRPSPHPALRRQLRATARLNRPPARTALRMRSPLPGMLTDGGGRAKREAAARGCPPRLASLHLASARLSHHAAGGRVSPGAVPPAPAPRLRSAGAPGTGRGVAGGRRRAPV